MDKFSFCFGGFFLLGFPVFPEFEFRSRRFQGWLLGVIADAIASMMMRV